jgi:hypothetical protein
MMTTTIPTIHLNEAVLQVTPDDRMLNTKRPNTACRTTVKTIFTAALVVIAVYLAR